MLRALSILETLSGVVLVTLALTFLLGVYQVVRDLSALCSKLLGGERVAGGPVSPSVAGLAPYFPQGRATGVDAHLQGLHDNFSSYIDGLRLHHVAYYFQGAAITSRCPMRWTCSAG